MKSMMANEPPGASKTVHRVEMAGAVAELARDFLGKAGSPNRRQGRILLVNAGSRVLPEFAADLSTYAARALTALQAGTIIWAAGTEATPVSAWLGVKPAHGGRVKVDNWLRAPGHPCVFVIGDAALAQGPDGRPLPGLATVAKQQGRYVVASILRRLRGERTLPTFQYRDYGALATIGRNEAVAEFGSAHLTGRPAWMIWAGAHIVFLISFRSKVLVSLQWLLAYVTNRRSAGLIVGPEPITSHPPVVKPG